MGVEPQLIPLLLECRWKSHYSSPQVHYDFLSSHSHAELSRSYLSSHSHAELLYLVVVL
jgi:hypothetical protein